MSSTMNYGDNELRNKMGSISCGEVANELNN